MSEEHLPGPEQYAPEVLAVGPFPPFVGGAAKNTAIICDALEVRGAKVTRLSTNRTRSRAEHSRSLGFLAERTVGFMANLRRIFFGRSNAGPVTAYLVPDGGLGVAFSVAYARIAASKCSRLVIHHRSYNHLRHRSRLMAMLMKTSPTRTIHVFLDPVMEQRFKETYRTEVRSTFVPNAATCDVTPDPGTVESGEQGRLTVGFLSNLVEEKGFDVVAEAFPLLAERLGPQSRFVLAGRPVGARNEARLTELRQRLGDRLMYLGEVAGEKKTEFFRTCDVFVFPTRFPQEAQPNVLYEALAGGAAIVSTRWAGVPWVLEGTTSRIIEAGADRCHDLVGAVSDIVDSGELAQAREHQIAAFAVKKADADSRYSQLIEILLGSTVT